MEWITAGFVWGWFKLIFLVRNRNMKNLFDLRCNTRQDTHEAHNPSPPHNAHYDASATVVYTDSLLYRLQADTQVWVPSSSARTIHRTGRSHQRNSLRLKVLELHRELLPLLEFVHYGKWKDVNKPVCCVNAYSHNFFDIN